MMEVDAEESSNSNANNNDNNVDNSSRVGEAKAADAGTSGGGAQDLETIDSDEEPQEDEEEEEQLVASFPEEDSNSRSRDGSAVHGLGDEESTDQTQNNAEGEENNDSAAAPQANAIEDPQQSQKEESNDSVSKTSNVSKENEESHHQEAPSQEDRPSESQEPNLIADETLQGDDDAEELTAEVDIASMMEVNFGEGESEASQSRQNRRNEEPEVIPIDDSDDDDNPNSNNDAEPVVAGVDQRVFQVDDDDNVTEMDISSMMQVDYGVSSEEVSEVLNNDSDSNPPSVSSSTSASNRRPRRAAAAAAAKTIHQISEVEQGVSSGVFRHRRKSQEDSEFDPYNALDNAQTNSPAPAPVKLQRCHICKKSAACSIVIKQFGSDLYLCSNMCFNRFRSQGQGGETKNTLPCSKCSLMDKQSQSSSNVTYFWETMNFCSDLCVGRYQMDVGSKCCTCGNNVPWNSLGKYCVRFGSDIRQFCNPQCLEEYKKNARVCFYCQLDIRRVGNVILANIPSKSSPREFCSNDCVEMYCDRNLHQPTRTKPQQQHICNTCQCLKVVYRELVLTNAHFKVCSEPCWLKLLNSKQITKPDKCEMCTKYVNMELGYTTPVYWVSTMNKVYGFCSHVCKNLFIQGSRRIMSCTSCKVKKYNYDLIEYFTNSSSTYAVCSLACLPRSSDYLKNIRGVLYLPQPTSDKTTPSAMTLGSTATVISSVPTATVQYPPSRTRQKRKNSTENKVMEVSNQNGELKIGDTDSILDILTVEEIKAIVEELQNRPKMRSVMCSAQPKTRTVETQTDISELNELRIIPLKTSQESAKLPTSASSVSASVGKTTSSEKENSMNQKDPHKVTRETELSSDSSDATPTLAISGRSMANGTISSNPTEPIRRQSSEKTNQNLGVSGEHQIMIPEKDITTLHTVPPSKPDICATPNPSSNLSAMTPSHFSSNSNQSSVYSSSYSHSPYSSPSLEPPAPAPNSLSLNPLITSPSVNYNAPNSSMFGGNYNISAPTALPPSLPTAVHPSSPMMPLGYGTHSHTLGYNRPPSIPLTAIAPPHQHTAPKNRVDYAIRAWRLMFGPASDPRSCSATELSFKLCELVNGGYSSNGQKYRADVLLYISLGVQQILSDAKRVDRLFYDNIYYSFVLALTDTAGREQTMGSLATVDELNFWETLELGATSPGVLLFTLIYLFRKHFGLMTWEIQSNLQFHHVVLRSRYDPYGKLVKYLSIVGMPGVYPTEVPENFERPEQCFVKMYEFYCFKNESREGPFFKCLRQDYTPRTPWFTCEPLHKRHIHQMLVRALMIKCYGFS